MPNWCFNRVDISSDGTEEGDEQLKAVHAIFSNPDPFNAIVPQPDWANTPNSKGELPQVITRTYRNLDGTEHTETLRYFGNKNDDRWHDRRLSHWGTKWDLPKSPSEVPIEEYEEGDYLKLAFDTAWSPPVLICTILRKRYPKLSFRWFFDEPGSESAGYL